MAVSQQGKAHPLDFVERVLVVSNAFPELSEREIADSFKISARTLAN